MKKKSFSGIDKNLKSLLKKGVHEGVFSGAALGWSRWDGKGVERHVVCAGTEKQEKESGLIGRATLFDLASLTKPLCTVQLILSLIQQGEMEFDTPLASLLPAGKEESWEKIKIHHVLSHTSGLRAYEPYYKLFRPIQGKRNREKLLKILYREQPVSPIGKKSLYSDLGFILLGEAIEKKSEKTLQELFFEKISKPQGVDKDICFRPVTGLTRGDRRGIAATQFCPWRQRLLQGEVDDEHSWLLNGVSGHAGLFGTVEGVLSLTTNLLQMWKDRVKYPAFNNELLTTTLTRQKKDQPWCLGFDTPTQGSSSCGIYFSNRSVGHLGFTGTSFWIDPVKEVVVVLLTNRIHPRRDNEQIREFRPVVHNVIMEGLQ